MCELMKDVAGEMILAGAKEVLTSVKEKREWKALFVDTGEFFIKDIGCAEKLIDDIAVLMSKSNMKELARSINKNNGFELRNSLEKELTGLMKMYEIPHDQAEYYTRHFIIVIIEYIKKNNPQRYTEVYMNDWREEEAKELEILQKRIDEVFQAMSVIKPRKLEIYATDEIERKLLMFTDKPSIDLDFFEIDDEQFQVEFAKRVLENSIYITGKCREEMIYCILNEMRRRKDKRAVLVVKNQKDWEGLRETGISNAVLIPWFYVEEIIAIPDNTNIFVYGEDEHCIGKNPLCMRKRTRNTIITRLEAAGMDYQAAYRLVEDTHGLYIPMKKRIFNGLYCKKPKWIEGDKNKLLAVLLCGKWTEAEGDKLVISQLAQCSYEDLMCYIEPYMIGEEPLVLKIKDHGKIYYQLAGVENAWDYLNPYLDVDSRMWKEFIKLLREVLIESDSIFNYPLKEHFYRSLDEEDVFWSSILKNGMLRSLIMKAYYIKDRKSQFSIDQVVKSIMLEINTPNKWMYITQYSQELCEASPEAVMETLESEWENPTGLKAVFTADGGEVFFGRNYYTNILWGVEQLLMQKEFASRAMRWLLRMDGFSIKYPINNSPKEILVNVFCPWLQLSALDTDDKIVLAGEAFGLDKNAWEIIYSELPGQKTTVVGSLSHPKYRDVTELPKLLNKDVYKAYYAYMELCINNMDFSKERWKKMLEAVDKFSEEYQDKLFKKLDYEIQSMDDWERMEIKNALRSEIHRHRYFSSAEWAMNSTQLVKFEAVMNRIQMNNPIYDYQYLFVARYNFPLLNPVPHNEDSAHERNEEAMEVEISDGLKEIKKCRYSIKKLSEICAVQDNGTLGIYLAKYYCNGNFDSDIMATLLEAQQNGRMAVDYVQYLYRQNETILERAINIAKDVGCSDDVLVNLYSLERLNMIQLPLIERENETVKRLYWRRQYFYQQDKEVLGWQIEQCKKYGTQAVFMNLLEAASSFLTADELLEHVIDMSKMEVGSINNLSSSYMEDILKVLQGAFIETDTCIKVAEVEILYHEILDWEQMKCTKRAMQKNPEIYAEMIDWIFIKDGQEEKEISEEKQKRWEHIYRLFDKAHFCPAEHNGVVDEADLRTWVTEFKKLLAKQEQSQLFERLLGRILAYSPIGSDDYYPCEAVRKIIEEYYDDSLKRSYAMSIFNMRGIFSPTAGKEEMEISRKYKENAEAIRRSSPKTASIYDYLSNDYRYEAEYAREYAEDIGI